MESAAKRKAASAAAPESESRPSKRQKLPGDAQPVKETVETTTTMGLKFLDSLRAAKDKTGRPIATHFLSLPDKDELPEYYDVIKLPIAIDTIEAKLNRGVYTTLAQVESDCKRLVNNAKAYNDKKSLIYEDAERVRKTASNWMVKHNPAYRDTSYQAVATPVPGEEHSLPGRLIPRVVAASSPKTPVPVPVAAPTPDSAARPRRAAAAPQPLTPAPSKLRHSASAPPKPEPEPVDDDTPGYSGKSFQQAQDQIVREMIDYQDPHSELQIFMPFVNLPSRSLKDYYQLIKHPMSLSAVQKKVRGVVGRNPPTGKTDLKSWHAFENEVSLIWTNAREYNEDGSDIYNLSVEFEEIFKQRLAEAKAKVQEPPQPKLKLNMSGPPKQQIKIKLRQSPSSDPNTPAARSSATPSVIVDNEALLRQQRHVQESMNGTRSSRPSSSGKVQTPLASSNPFSGPKGASSSVPPLSLSQSRTAGSPPAVNGIKNDVQSPALNSIRPASTASDSQSQRLSVPAQTPHPVMPPPRSMSRPASGSPHPTGPIGQQTGSYSQYTTSNYYVPPTTPHFENLRKAPLKSIDEALIPKITLTTHPALNLPKPFFISIPAHKEKTSHSITISLASSHSYLQIVPHIPVALTNRLYRLFVIVNGNKTFEVNRVPVTAGINGNSIAAGFEGGKKKGEPLFEAKLSPGVNRIEVEAIAEKDKKTAGKTEGRDGKDPKEQVEVEKCTIFVHLMRAY
ncbi:Bromodomain-containing protein [Lindgomyces ingoldianus]|uniref:Bromodomain-containing protein n=1 Tax=Lindgomyces ingoldianus TaxID=673940 RepID=A0ACB6QMR2_9PLEO|nr:Bromodomain-containing protein [Lindgomyces ingoldianus]KAF2467407.1 Bromodomain-containing protein [Lindgomyces ingoldianus]